MLCIDRHNCFPGDLCKQCKKSIGKIGQKRNKTAFYVWDSKTLATIEGPFCSYDCSNIFRENYSE